LTFDDLYPLHSLEAAREKKKKRVVALVESHRAKLTSGEIVSRQPNALNLAESISLPLDQEFSAFLGDAVRAFKNLQYLLSFLGVEVACLFGKDSKFRAGTAALRAKGEAVLAEYLSEVRRSWSERLLNRRNLQEHKGWRLPMVTYAPGSGGPVEMNEPLVDGQPVSAFASEMLGHVLAFTEDMVAFAVQKHIRPPFTLAVIPPADRDPENQRRFFLTVPALQPTAQIWSLKYSPAGLSRELRVPSFTLWRTEN
jgi:hypothetical protein